MPAGNLPRLLDLLRRLREAKIPYTLEYSRENAVTVIARSPGEYWEIDFPEDDEINVERFRSDGEIHDESMLKELFALWSDDGTPTAEGAVQHESNARK
jgi:hypothetical protein